MREAELYRAIPSLIPAWMSVNLGLDVRGQQVTVRVDAGDRPSSCPECHTPVPGHDRKPRRRHFDTYQRMVGSPDFRGEPGEAAAFKFFSACVTKVTDAGRVF